MYQQTQEFHNMYGISKPPNYNMHWDKEPYHNGVCGNANKDFIYTRRIQGVGFMCWNWLRIELNFIKYHLKKFENISFIVCSIMSSQPKSITTLKSSTAHHTQTKFTFLSILIITGMLTAHCQTNHV